jgi:hypothetical protein
MCPLLGQAIVVLLRLKPRRKGGMEEMNYQMHFDPYMREHLKQREEELLREVEALRLEERLRKNRKLLRGSRLATLISRGAGSLSVKPDSLSSIVVDGRIGRPLRQHSCTSTAGAT